MAKKLQYWHPECKRVLPYPCGPCCPACKREAYRRIPEVRWNGDSRNPYDRTAGLRKDLEWKEV